MSYKKLSIVIPVYNEKNTIIEILERVESADVKGLEKEIIIIDDYSTDGTREVLKKLENKYQIVYQEINQGKGSALKKGFAVSTGDIVLIQDADLEYDPDDYSILLEPILNGRADVVFGSRFRGEKQRVLYYWHSVGNKFLTFLSNALTNLNLSDMETCYKVFNRKALDSFKDKLKSCRFGIEPEITSRIAHKNWRIYEVPVNYYGRTYKEGKKINWRDGFKAIWAILFFNIIDK